MQLRPTKTYRRPADPARELADLEVRVQDVERTARVLLQAKADLYRRGGKIDG